MSSSLKLVILFDAKRNTYTVCDHNLTDEESVRQVMEWRRKLLKAFRVDQHSEHTNPDPQLCRTCRRDVGHASGLTPKPKFKRRHSV